MKRKIMVVTAAYATTTRYGPLAGKRQCCPLSLKPVLTASKSAANC